MMADEDPNENNNSDDKKNCCRQLRVRCKNKLFSDDMWLVTKDEDDFGGRKAFHLAYNLPDQLKNPKYADHGYVKELNGYNFTVDYLDRNGFAWPVLIRNKHSLGLKVPESSFGVNDVRRGVGSDRIVDVIDVHTQKDFQMTMKEYQKYYESHEKDKLYNVISLEFSHTKLDDSVTQPGIVRKLDWVDLYWPRTLKSKQMDSTNIMKNMMYPKVQKYCLMSVKGCYTDFHVDFGGTSVWYHILKGVKVFWLIRPTDENLALYQNWVLTDKRLDCNRYTFLGDVVDQCERIVLKAGQTFFIPSGWLHAVYTPKDSIVFGGNFLHSYSIDMQIKISRVEDDTRVMKKFRYPYFTEIHWYTLDGLVRRFLRMLDMNTMDCMRRDVGFQNAENVSNNNLDYKKHMNTVKTIRLLKSMKSILDYLNDLSDSRKDIPEHFHDHEALLRDASFIYENYKTILNSHDVEEFHETGYSVDGNLVKKFKRKPKYLDEKNTNMIKKFKTIVVANGAIYRKHTYRRRRTRCRTCEACSKDDCGSCIYCKDMIKYGGNGRAKQSCILRQCLQPVLPSNSVCIVCNRGCPSNADEKSGEVTAPDSSKTIIIQTVINAFNRGPGTCPNDDNLLMECAICYEIVHPRCLFDVMSDCDSYDIANNINDDLPNSWKCPKCYAKKQSDEEFFNKQRFFKARSKVLNHGKMESVKSANEEMKFDDNKSASSQEDLTAPSI